MSKNLSLLEKAKALAAQADAMTIAYLREDGYPRASTLSLMKADGIETLYACTSIHSPKARRIEANPKVSLCLRRDGDNITLTGEMTVSQDDTLRNEIWQDWCYAHFPDGPLGESFCVLVFRTREADAWIDGESGSLKWD